jgi:hypothetical protein
MTARTTHPHPGAGLDRPQATAIECQLSLLKLDLKSACFRLSYHGASAPPLT